MTKAELFLQHGGIPPFNPTEPLPDQLAEVLNETMSMEQGQDFQGRYVESRDLQAKQYETMLSNMKDQNAWAIYSVLHSQMLSARDSNEPLIFTIPAHLERAGTSRLGVNRVDRQTSRKVFQSEANVGHFHPGSDKQESIQPFTIEDMEFALKRYQEQQRALI